MTHAFPVEPRAARRLPAILGLACVLAAAHGPAQPTEKPLAERVRDRDFPSVFQAWNPIDMPSVPLRTLEDRLRAAARHDLTWEEPVSQLGYRVDLALGAVWDHAHGGLATRFAEKSLHQALENRRRMLAVNPNLVFLMEVRWRDAPGSFLPEGSPFWKRKPDGSRVLGWDNGPEPYYLLDADNPEFAANIARQSRIAVESGVYDGIMLDWSGHLPIVKRVREAIGERGLIVVNIHDDIEAARQYRDYINGAFMENNPAGEGNPITPRSLGRWDSIAQALLYYERHFREPRVNCLEVWGDRKDERRMRAATTLALTHSDGYVLFADPNPLKTPDHLHDWYTFWDAPLGRPIASGTERPDGAFERHFTNGTAVYNPPGNPGVTVRFDAPRRRASDGSLATEFTVRDRDGDIFLGPK